MPFQSYWALCVDQRPITVISDNVLNALISIMTIYDDPDIYLLLPAQNYRNN